MKPRTHTLSRTTATVAVAFFCFALMSHGAATKTNAAVESSSESQPIPAATEIPRSAFVVPRSPREGRDPFFPQSTRFSAATVANPNTKSNQPPVVVELALKGISGTRERPLAIINNQTFAAGEANDVASGTRRVRIRCVEINAETGVVIVEVGNERRELRLKQRK